MLATCRHFGLAAAGLALPVPAIAQVTQDILARFSNGTFLENLVVEPDGIVLFTNYFARRLEAWSPGGGHRLHAAVPA